MEKNNVSVFKLYISNNEMNINFNEKIKILLKQLS